MIPVCLLILFLLFIPDRSPAQPRQVHATRARGVITVDGRLTEPDWHTPGTTGFTQKDPDEGTPCSQHTEVWVVYDDAAVYIGARMHDTAPDSIVARLGRRDADVESDWFFVGIDSYHDKQTGFYFGVNPRGCIQDGTLFNDTDDDDAWDGVWDGAAQTDTLGWSVEMRIPYSQLRFRKHDEYVWGINFLRIIERRKEESYFVMVPKKESGGVSRYAELVGIRNIEPPLTLEFLPYLASSGSFTRAQQGNPFQDGSRFLSNVGADVKIGLGSNMTLDATINPDFGQVEVDPAVVNLSQYETFFEEKRPFFIEGTSLFNFGRGGANSRWGFNWGSPDYFYSRRIGRPPQGSVQHAGFADVPDRTTILGAAKLTGKITDHWSLGAVSALTPHEHAVVDSSGARFRDVVEPLTSYSAVRSLREFQDGQKAVGFIGTAVLRDLNEPYLPSRFNRRSYALGVDGWTNLDADRVWVLTGWVAGTRIEGTQERIRQLQESHLHYFHRPDADHLRVDSNATALTGYAGRFALNKQEGNWKFNAALGFISSGFNSNDLGFLFQTDLINGHVVIGHQWYEPTGTLRQRGFSLATFRNFDFDGKRIGDGYFLFYNVEFTNYWGIEGNFRFTPATLDTRNTRGGPAMIRTRGYGASVYGYSDSRKTWVLNAELFGGRTESGGYILGFSPGINLKPTESVSLRFAPSMWRDVTIAHWVTRVQDPAATHTYGTRYVFGKLDQRQVSASIRLDWTFTPKLTLQVYIQPLLSVGSYTEFKELKQPGTYTFVRYGEEGTSIDPTPAGYSITPGAGGTGLPFQIANPDFNFKSLRGNAVLRWEYLPGSTLYLAWTQSRVNTEDPGSFRFGRDLSSLFASEADNIFLVKIAYWLAP